MLRICIGENEKRDKNEDFHFDTWWCRFCHLEGFGSHTQFEIHWWGDNKSMWKESLTKEVKKSSKFQIIVDRKNCSPPLLSVCIWIYFWTHQNWFIYVWMFFIRNYWLHNCFLNGRIDFNKFKYFFSRIDFMYLCTHMYINTHKYKHCKIKHTLNYFIIVN